MKMQVVLVREIVPVSFLMACDMEAGLYAHVLVAHVAVDFAFGGQRGHRVDHEDVNCRRADQLLGYFEGLLAVVGLSHEEVVDVHPSFSA